MLRRLMFWPYLLYRLADNYGESPLLHAETHGHLFNYLAWLAYEVRAQEIMQELEKEKVVNKEATEKEIKDKLISSLSE